MEIEKLTITEKLLIMRYMIEKGELEIHVKENYLVDFKAKIKENKIIIY